MNKVYQKIFHKKGEDFKPEDSLQAVLASLLELPLKETIAIQDYYPKDGEEENIHWEFILNQWLQSKGYELTSTLEMVQGELYIVTGTVNRGTTHCAIYKVSDGLELELVHDPHVSGDGIDQENIQYIEKLEYVGIMN